MSKYDFSGWATKANVACSDGRTIMKDAFKDDNGKTVPLVWMHQHNDPYNVLGHALLESRDGDMYAYCKFNDSESGRTAKLLVQHGDVTSLSIYANHLKQNMDKVLHGNIREVSLVLAGANPEAYIDSVLMHGEDSEEEGTIYTGEPIDLYHEDVDEPETTEDSEEIEEPEDKKEDKGEEEMDKEKEAIVHADEEEESKEKTIGEIFETLTDEQKDAVYAIIGSVVQDSDEDENDKGGDDSMKHNVFDQDDRQENVLSHSDIEQIFADAKRYGSLKDAVEKYEVSDDVLAHAVYDEGGNEVTYGMANIDYLFPDARNVSNVPDFISRNTEWVTKVMGGAKHLPFSRVRSLHADITMDEARAKGYVKGNQKTEEVFALLRRVTVPTTIYKKQKLDRDDIIDITDFDVVAWLKSEMRFMLDEEIARAALVSDGRTPGTDDKIGEDNIRPIWKDDDVYVVRKGVEVGESDTDEDKAKNFIRTIIKSRKDYKGSGNPTLFTTEDVLTDCLLIEDGNGRVIYDTMDKLKTALRVSDIVTVPVMENLTREGSGLDTNSYKLMGIVVNMADYAFGADKGGAVSMFDDFDIDFNAQKYLIETRCSGALIKPYSAIVVEEVVPAEG